MENENKKDKQVIREFWLSTWAVNNKNTVYLIVLAILSFGTFSYVTLPKELFPEINIPTVMIQTFYPGNAPVDIENLITRQLEKEVESVNQSLCSLQPKYQNLSCLEFHMTIPYLTSGTTTAEA